MKVPLTAALVSLALLGAGCAAFTDKETEYLRSAQGRAGQDEIQRQMGKPYLVAATQKREPIWVYQVRSAEKGGNGNWSIAGFWCDEYVLIFDRQGILESWTHKSQKHRDDRDQPDICVNGGFEAAP